MKPARELLKSGRVSEAKYEPPLLSGYVREGVKNYRSGLRIKSAIDVENLCSCWESRSAGKICAHSVAVGLGYLNPPGAVVAAPNEATIPEAPIGPRFVAADSADAALTTLHVILPPNFAGAWQKGQIMIVVEAEASRNRTLVSVLPKKNTIAVDGADLVLIESLRASPAIFESGMATLSRDAFLRLLLALQNHPRITFGKATRATISSAALRPELLVESRGEGGIAVKCNFAPNALLLWNATEAWLLRNNEFVRCGEALPAGSTHLIERPLLLDGDRALHFLAFDLPRLRDAFDVRAGEGVRLPEIATALPAFELRLAGTLFSVSGELMCSYGDRAPIKALANAQDQFVFRDPQNSDRVLMRNVDAENAAITRLEQNWLRPNRRRRLRSVRPAECCPFLRGRLSETAARLEGDTHCAGREVERRDRARHAEARDCRLGSGLVRSALLTDHARRRGVFERRHPTTASLRAVTDTIKEWPPGGDRHRGPGGFRAGHTRLRSGADTARALPHQPRPRNVCRTNGARAWLRRRRSS